MKTFNEEKVNKEKVNKEKVNEEKEPLSLSEVFLSYTSDEVQERQYRQKVRSARNEDFFTWPFKTRLFKIIGDSFFEKLIAGNWHLFSKEQRDDFFLNKLKNTPRYAEFIKINEKKYEEEEKSEEEEKRESAKSELVKTSLFDLIESADIAGVKDFISKAKSAESLRKSLMETSRYYVPSKYAEHLRNEEEDKTKKKSLIKL